MGYGDAVLGAEAINVWHKWKLESPMQRASYAIGYIIHRWFTDPQSPAPSREALISIVSKAVYLDFGYEHDILFHALTTAAQWPKYRNYESCGLEAEVSDIAEENHEGDAGDFSTTTWYGKADEDGTVYRYEPL